MHLANKLHYILIRLLLIIPTLFGIMLINFAIIQFAPSGPVEQMIAKMSGHGNSSIFENISSSDKDTNIRSQTPNLTLSSSENNSKYAGARGLDPEVIHEIEKMYGFDKPVYQRFFIMLGNYLVFDFGESFFKGEKVIDLVISKLPVSISLGLWSMLIIYLISIPLGISKAVRDGSKFDITTSFIITILYSIPSFLFAILLVILFAGGEFWQIFPLRGLVSENFADLSFFGKIKDYFWHMALPIISLSIGGFAGLTILTKNLFLEEISKQYVLTAYAKGLGDKKVLYGHVFRNAMIIVLAEIPDNLVKILFTGALFIEIIFSLDGLGFLGFEAVLNRDYPVMFGTLYFFTLISLILNIIRDIMYMVIDPRINFSHN